jgi:DUF4097 and DUF4098 domain-containing protein YvlB
MNNINKNNFILNISLTLTLFLFFSSLAFAKELELLKEKSFKVTSGQLLSVKSDVGDVTVKTWEKSEVLVKVFGDNDAKRKMEFSFNQDENGVEVIGEKTGGGIFSWFRGIDLRYEIIVPAKFDLKLKTSGGDLTTKNISGELNFATSGGDVFIKNVKGNVNALTSGGDVSVFELLGNIEASTSGGDIQINSEKGSVHVSTSGGDVSLKTSEGKIDAKTSGGDITLDYQGQNNGVVLATSGGDIDVKIPSNFNADIELKTSGGDVKANFTSKNLTKIEKSKIIGKLNDGGQPLICKTSGGDIVVVEK